MTPMPRAFIDQINRWPEAAQLRFANMRTMIHQVATAAETGPLDESLKWGQPAWRPCKPRTGSTLRLNWSQSDPGHIMAYVDCKTDIAAQMKTRFPQEPANDMRRALAFDLHRDNADALWQLAFLTLTYHRTRRAIAR